MDGFVKHSREKSHINILIAKICRCKNTLEPWTLVYVEGINTKQTNILSLGSFRPCRLLLSSLNPLSPLNSQVSGKVSQSIFAVIGLTNNLWQSPGLPGASINIFLNECFVNLSPSGVHGRSVINLC